MRCGTGLLLAGIMCLAYTGAQAAEGIQAPSLSFGLVPQQSASKMARLWTPIFQYLSAKTGYQIHYKTAKDIPTFESRLVAGEYDLAYMNPYHYTVFSNKPGYRVFAKEKDRYIQGIIVTHQDSPIRVLRDLQDQTLAFPAPAAFASSVLVRAHLRQLGINIKPKYVSSHDSVYRTVAKGLYPAGGGIVRTLDNLDPTIRGKLKVLWTSKRYTPHAITAHPRVSAEVVQRLQQAMLDMSHDAQGIELLREINFSGLGVANDGDYNDIRRLGITILEQYKQ